MGLRSQSEFSIGSNIKKALQRRRPVPATQQELAEFCGVDKSHVSKWCNDVIRPNRNYLVRISEFTDRTVDEILNGVFKEDKPARVSSAKNDLIMGEFIEAEIDSTVSIIELMLVQVGDLDEDELDEKYGKHLDIIRNRMRSIASISE